MDTFLEKHNLLKLSQEITYLNSPITKKNYPVGK